MNAHRWLIIVGLLALSLPVCGAEVTTLKGDKHTGEVLSVTDKQVQLRGDKELTLSAAEIVSVDLLPPGRALPTTPFLRIRLIDGTLLRAHAFGLAGKAATVRLFSGITLKLPVSALHWVLCEAQEERNQAELDELLARKPGQDQLRLLSRDGQAVNLFEGFLGEADAAGENIAFTPEGGTKVNVALSRVRGMVFARKLDDKAPPAVTKVHDSFGNVFACHQVATTADAFQLGTPAGLTLEAPRAFVQRFDFSLGKIAYLSDLDPVRLEETPILADLWHYRRDKNLEGEPLSLGRKTYAKGLALHSRTVIEYEVRGYNVFRSVVGIDERVTGPAHAIVKIEADGKELFSTPVTGKDQPRELELKLDGAARLRITVDYGEDLDLGDHVILADARLMK